MTSLWIDLPVLDGYYVYALYAAGNDDVPLYVGQSSNALCRIGNHMGAATKRPQVARIAVRRCASRADMDATEQALITAYCPPWNRAGLPYGSTYMHPSARHPHAAGRNASRTERLLNSHWLTTRDVATRLGCTVTAVNAYVADGALRSTPEPRQRWTERRFRPEWIADFLIDKRPDLIRTRPVSVEVAS